MKTHVCLHCKKSYLNVRKNSKYCCASCANKSKALLLAKINQENGKYLECIICKQKKSPNLFSFEKRGDFLSGKKTHCKQCGANARETARRNRTWKDDAAKILLSGSRQRAKRIGMINTLTYSDISIPDICPVLGIPLHREDRSTWMNAPSIDRIDNSIGYIPSNIIIVSRRANMLKKDATKEELIKIAEFYSKV